MRLSGGIRSHAALAIALALGFLTRCAEHEDVAPSPSADASVAMRDAGVIEMDAEAPCPAEGPQTELRCTGLYTDTRAKAVATDVLPFAPAFPLWSDGAQKSRWVRLPAGTKIDTSDMNEWRFPIGTKFWKEFALGGRRIETRLIEKKAEGTWLRQTFKWSEDETSTTELRSGEKGVRGTTYEIPPQGACELCHDGRVDGVLGFEAVSLSGPGATGLTMTELVARDLVTQPPAAPITVPGNATQKAALTWLHANCGTSCHSKSTYARAGFTYLFLRLNVGQLGSVAATDSYTSAVKVVSGYQPDPGQTLFRIEPQSPSRSVIFRRASVRDVEQKVQMPPVATNIVDEAGIEALKAWILALPP